MISEDIDVVVHCLDAILAEMVNQKDLTEDRAYKVHRRVQSELTEYVTKCYKLPSNDKQEERWREENK